MAEELPDGTTGGYTGICEKCGKAIKTNMQGNKLETHDCISQGLFGLTIGQEITWRCELRGGYGKVLFVKGIVVKLNPKRVKIKAELAKGGFKEVSVDYTNIKESDQYKPILVCGGKKI